ncbi:MAG: hypothetical protein LBP95_04260 [Deltaproteobacteria bacterium]|jgi:hypothetical protein|nr:hypothetical protein [Deltaproteobacteria bacterium]
MCGRLHILAFILAFQPAFFLPGVQAGADDQWVTEESSSKSWLMEGVPFRLVRPPDFEEGSDLLVSTSGEQAVNFLKEVDGGLYASLTISVSDGEDISGERFDDGRLTAPCDRTVEQWLADSRGRAALVSSGTGDKIEIEGVRQTKVAGMCGMELTVSGSMKNEEGRDASVFNYDYYAAYLNKRTHVPNYISVSCVVSAEEKDKEAALAYFRGELKSVCSRLVDGLEFLDG